MSQGSADVFFGEAHAIAPGPVPLPRLCVQHINASPVMTRMAGTAQAPPRTEVARDCHRGKSTERQRKKEIHRYTYSICKYTYVYYLYMYTYEYVYIYIHTLCVYMYIYICTHIEGGTGKGREGKGREGRGGEGRVY